MKAHTRRVLIVGATGHFGGRIARSLAREPDVEVLLGGRRSGALRALASDLGIDPNQTVVISDLSEKSIAIAARSRAIGTLIHTVGPYQSQAYSVARGAIAAGAHYIDLADGREFVANFAAMLDPAARAAGVLAVSGASTLPAVSSAVIDDLACAVETITEIQIVIAPAQRTPRGLATIEGVLSYCGERFRWKHNGVWCDTHGWQSLRRVSLPELGVRLAAACDVPDLQLLPERYPTAHTVQFRAALEVPLQHLGLWCLAGLRRAWPGLPIKRFIPVFAMAARALDRFGGVRGGMTVTVRGTARGRPAARTWFLVAEDNQGPEIPCLAAELLAINLARGTLNRRGAQPCMGLLTLADYEGAFARLPYRWGVLDERGSAIA